MATSPCAPELSFKFGAALFRGKQEAVRTHFCKVKDEQMFVYKKIAAPIT